MATKKSAPIVDVEEKVEALIPPIPVSEETITFKLSHFYSVLVVLAFMVGILVGYVAWGRTSPITTAMQQPSGQAGQAPVATPKPVPVIYDIESKGFPSRGPEDAPITIVEFSDYQCPFCFRWHEQVYDSLLAAYPNQIRFVYRNFPLTSIHPNAFAAAESALCAGDQDKYWEMHDALFDAQSLLNSQEGTVLDQPAYNQFATDLGMDVTVFEECMTTHKYKQAIEDDMTYAENLPFDSTGEAAVGGTPTFFVNGHRLGGAYPLEYFKAIIDAELAKK